MTFCIALKTCETSVSWINDFDNFNPYAYACNKQIRLQTAEGHVLSGHAVVSFVEGANSRGCQ